MNNNIWLDGMMGLVTGDALGNPVQFMEREEVRSRGNVVSMEAGGAYNTPAGTWTDDSSMALATLDSIREIGTVVPEDIMLGFVKWYCYGEYTPFGEAFDMGNTCSQAIINFTKNADWKTCGLTGEWANGNGALMRILPVCIHFMERRMNGEIVSDEEALTGIHQVTALTHNHLRARIAGGLYFFMAWELKNGGGDLRTRLQRGINKGFAYYRQDVRNLVELSHFTRIHDLRAFIGTQEKDISSSGYVISTLEAAVWSLITTDNFKDCLIKAVNLGDDADTVGAVAGSLAGLYYGYDQIPEGWLQAIQRREWIEDLCTSDYTTQIPVADIHVHLIPGIDDGSQNMEMTMQMIRSEYRQGVRAIICTPHADGLIYQDQLQAGWKEIQNRCREEFPDLKLGLGCEIYLTPEYLADSLDLLKKGILLTLNGTRHVLVEFPQDGIPFEEIQECIRGLTGAGWLPVIAHAERYDKSYRSIDDIRWLKENGCRIQINIYSIKEDISKQRRTLTRQMLEEKLVDFLGTDSHRMNHRPPRIVNGIKELSRIIAPEYLKQIVWGNVQLYFGL